MSQKAKQAGAAVTPVAAPSLVLPGDRDVKMKDVQRAVIELALARYQGNRTHAARAMGIAVRTLTNRIREYGLPPRRPPEPEDWPARALGGTE